MKRLVALWVSLAVALSPLAGSFLHAQTPVVFIHGIFTGDGTWQSEANRLSGLVTITSDWQPGNDQAATFEDQAAKVQQTYGDLPGSAIAVGHSNGGIVAREWSKAHSLAGIITIDSPHQGAPLLLPGNMQNIQNGTDFLQFLIGDFFSIAYDCWDCPVGGYDPWEYLLDSTSGLVSWLGDVVYSAWYYVVGDIVFSSWEHVATEMFPGAPYLDGLNSSGNISREASAVPVRLGISSRVSAPWWGGPVRLAGGDGAANTKDEIVGVLLGTAAILYANSDSYGDRLYNIADNLTSIGLWMGLLDMRWCQSVSFPNIDPRFGVCADNDLVVPLWSQDYPGANATFLIDGGPRHTDETSNDMVGDLISTYLTQLWGIPPVDNSPPQGSAVSIQAINGQWVTAEGGGGGVVNANRDAIGPWETFHLVDFNGGDLQDGDAVAFQTDDGLFLQADQGGGGAMIAVGQAPGAWETFTLIDLDNPGGPVRSGDAIALLSNAGYYATAENGGGDVVNVNRYAIGPWETFRLYFD